MAEPLPPLAGEHPRLPGVRHVYAPLYEGSHHIRDITLVGRVAAGA
jgi:hypothetical protein